MAEQFRILSGAVCGALLTHFPGQVWCTPDPMTGLILGYFYFSISRDNGSILTELELILFGFRQDF
jgi:hypothetical protein